MIILLISFIAIGLTILLYLRSLGLAPLRIIAIILLYVLITGFTLSLKSKKKINPPVLLIDCSASMAKYFKEVTQDINEIDLPFSRFFFSETLFKTVPEKLMPSGRFTDISRAIAEVSKLQPAAIILISDGNHNYGSFPFSAVKDFGIPIHCFGVGAESLRDLAIVDVLYPEYAFVGDSVEIGVVVQSEGFESGTARMQLRSTDSRIAKTEIFPLSDTRAKNRTDFAVCAWQPGTVKVAIKLAPQPGELTYQNNELEFSLHVLKDKLKVVYYTDHLSFNTKFILRALEQDDRIDLEPLIKISKEEYLDLRKEQKQTFVPALDKCDVLILDNIDFSGLPWKNIEKFLKQGLGILYMGTVQGHTTLWRDVLPINTTGPSIKGNHQIEIIEPFSSLTPGDEYPPLSSINRVLGVKENAVIIAKANNMPLMAHQNYEKSKVFQINSADIGTWQFLQLGLKQKDLLSYLMSDIVRFISASGKNRRLMLKTLRRDFNVGEAIDLTLQSFDRNFRLTGGGDFYAVFDNKKTPFFETDNGVYKASIIPEKSGKFSVKAAGKLGEESLNSNELEISVSAAPIEIEQGLNKGFLETLSRETDGKYYSIDKLADFEMPVSKEVQTLKKINFDAPASYILILCLLTVEWILRRRKGAV